ncbi:unnamed protein product [Paramecium sonneborni]|uniref:WD40-repeat-containing domain n=1 Tax=Paramecium sonneborni TaxID=65129 RepID=A0A8S1KVG5_9CILI|nr:unnamed protein product [Paramecium sonneborni]
MQYTKFSLIEHLTKRNIKCYQHNQPLSYLDMSKVCEDRSRMKCDNCQKNQYCIKIQQFNQLCEQFYQISKNSNDQIKETYKKIYLDIQNILNQMNDKIQNSIFKPLYSANFIKCLESYLLFLYSFDHNYVAINKINDIGLQEFEYLTQCMSEQVNFKEIEKKLILKQQALDDQKQAEQNQYLDLVQQLNQLINNFVMKNNLINAQIQNQNIKNEQIDMVKTVEKNGVQFFDQDGQKLSSNSSQSIADIQLNFDQTILAARFCEPCTNIFFWKLEGFQNKWIKDKTLKSYSKTLVYFKFSKLQNILITSGSDDENHVYLKTTKAQIKIWILKADVWLIKQIYEPQLQPGLGQQRIQCATFNQEETEIIFAEGTRLVFLYEQQSRYLLKYYQEKSSELITCLQISSDGKLLAVGACDQKVIIWKINEAKLILFQILKLYNTPKRILFSKNDQDLIICTKDGLVHCFNNQDSKKNEYKENQKIFNNISKIRTIEFNKDSSILAIGGETNKIQLWKKDDQNQWKCFNEYQQDNFIESICFGNSPDVIYASNNNEIYIHNIF